MRAVLYLVALGCFVLYVIGLGALFRPRPRVPAPAGPEAALEGALASLGLEAAPIEAAAEASSRRQGVLEVLSAAGRPMAAEEIADMLGVGHYVINPRLAELEQQGFVVRTDERHQNRSGRRAARFRLADGGHA